MKIPRLYFKPLYFICGLILSLAQQNVRAAVAEISANSVESQKEVAVVASESLVASMPLFTKIAGPTGKVLMEGNDVWVLDDAGILWYCNKEKLAASENSWQKVKLPKVDQNKKDITENVTKPGDITIDEDGSLWLLGGQYNEKKGGFEVFEGDVSINKKKHSASVKWDKKDGRMVKISAGKTKKRFLKSDNEHIWGIDAKGQLYCREKIRKKTIFLKKIRTYYSDKWTKIKKASNVALTDVIASEKDQILVIDNNKKLYKINIDSSFFNASDVEKSKLVEQQVGAQPLSFVTTNIFVGNDFVTYYLAEVSDMKGKTKHRVAQKMSDQIPAATAAAVNDNGDMIVVGHDGALYYAAQVLSKIMPKKIMTLGKPVCVKPAVQRLNLPGTPNTPVIQEGPETPQVRRDWCGTMPQFNKNNQQNDQPAAPAAPSAPIGEIKEEVVHVGTGLPEAAPAQ